MGLYLIIFQIKCLFLSHSLLTLFSHLALASACSPAPVTVPPFAVLNLMPKTPSGPPGLWLALRIIPPMALYFLITQEMAGVDIIPWCPMIRRPTWGNVTQVSSWVGSRVCAFNGRRGISSLSSRKITWSFYWTTVAAHQWHVQVYF